MGTLAEPLASGTMPRYRKLPVEIDAVQLVAGQVDAALELLTASGADFMVTAPFTVAVRTLEGTMQADPGDWLIRGVKGEVYPCKPDIFAATYEPA